MVIDIAAAITAQAAPSATSLDCFKGRPPWKLARVREGEGLPGEVAAHEHSHGALYICPNGWERQGRHFLKGQGANESSVNVPTKSNVSDKLTDRQPGEMTYCITGKNNDPSAKVLSTRSR